MRQDGRTFVWYDSKGEGRNLYAEFRRTVEIETLPVTAQINLFADTVYQIKVNGVFVGFGPVRFDPDYPLYDSYDLSNYLRIGKNIISVIVNYFGLKTFKSFFSKAGMTAWGTVGDIVISTQLEGWKCRLSPSRLKFMQKISFALNTIEIVDQTDDEGSWYLPDYDDSKWAVAVPVEHQDVWGDLKPRNIKYMALQDLAIEGNAKVFPLTNKESIVGFETPTCGMFSQEPLDFSTFIAFSTWIWSPCKQLVSVGTFWGETWLNGEFVQSGIEDASKVMRINQIWNLNEGWNFFFGKVGSYCENLCQLYAVPEDCGLVFSADKKIKSPFSFKHTIEIKSDVYEKFLENKNLPYEPDDELIEIGGWNLFSRDMAINVPTRISAWDSYGSVVESYNLSEFPKKFSKQLYPQGFSIFVDLNQVRLIFPEIRIRGVKGAIVDMTHSEEMSLDGEHLMYIPRYQSGDRVICSQDELHFIPIQPRGMRYLMITVRGAESDVQVDALKIIDASYPVDEIGAFECSDAMLNSIWKMCVLTQKTNMEDVYVDCTTRERGMYVRDTVIQYYNNLVVFGDEDLMYRCMQLYGQSAKHGVISAVYPTMGEGNYSITDFSLDAVEGYYVQYLNTGNTDPLLRDWEDLKNNISCFCNLSDEREDKLLDTKGKFFYDNDIAEGYIDKTGVNCGYSCFYLIALNNMREMALAIGELADAKQYEDRARFLKESINKNFFDIEFGAYKENLETDLHSNQCNLLAIRSGAISEEQITSVKEFLKDNIPGMFINGFDPSDGCRFSPSFSFYIFDALYMVELYDVAEELMRSGWGYFIQKGFNQCPEYFNLGGGLSNCHAWSATPLFHLSRNLSGVSYPEAPNLNKIQIDIKTSIVKWAKVTLPHPKGKITVEWHQNGNEKVIDLLNVPYGVDVSVLK